MPAQPLVSKPVAVDLLGKDLKVNFYLELYLLDLAGKKDEKFSGKKSVLRTQTTEFC